MPYDLKKLDRALDAHNEKVGLGDFVNFGEYIWQGYRTPRHSREVFARPTLWERFIRKLLPEYDNPEERELKLQLARRLKMRTDLQELRIRKRLEKIKSKADWEKKLFDVGFFSVTLEYNKERVYMVVTMRQDNGGTHREIEVTQVVSTLTGKVLSANNNALMAGCLTWFKGTTLYNGPVRDWLNGGPVNAVVKHGSIRDYHLHESAKRKLA